MRATVTDWTGLATRARVRRRWRTGALTGVLVVVSAPILLPYLWMLVLALTARGGGVDTAALWRICAVLIPTAALWVIARATLPARLRRVAGPVALALAVTGLWLAVGEAVHLNNFRFLLNPNLIEDGRGPATAGGQFPSVWRAFASSLLLAGGTTAISVVVASMAGYYLSRFAFAGRSGMLQGLLVLQAFPAMTLVIPLFLVSYWSGLLNSLAAPLLVITALELPFFIFIMKGFFDAVPWEIEMSALTDGATRRQAFRLVVLPQVRAGMIAIGVFAFIKGWEDYVFVNALRTGDGYWVMSTYLYYVAEDVMGVDYGLVAAVAVFYLMPSLLLYLLCQKYLTQMSVGGVKG